MENKNVAEPEIMLPNEIGMLSLSLSEKAVLAHILNYPKCTNRMLARLIGISERGVKKMLQRLRSRGLIGQTGKGRARRVRLTFHVKQGTQFTVPKNQNPEANGELDSQSEQGSNTGVVISCVIRKKPLSLADDFDQTLLLIDEMTRTRDFLPETVVRMLDALIRRIEQEMPACPEKEDVLRELYMRHAAFIAVCMSAKMPKKVQREIDWRISRATPEQLLEFRRCVQLGQLNFTAPLMLAGFMPEA